MFENRKSSVKTARLIEPYIALFSRHPSKTEVGKIIRFIKNIANSDD